MGTSHVLFNPDHYHYHYCYHDHNYYHNQYAGNTPRAVLVEYGFRAADMVKLLKVLSARTISGSYCGTWTEYILWSTVSRKTGKEFDLGSCEMKLGDTRKLYNPGARKN